MSKLIPRDVPRRKTDRYGSKYWYTKGYHTRAYLQKWADTAPILQQRDTLPAINSSCLASWCTNHITSVIIACDCYRAIASSKSADVPPCEIVSTVKIWIFVATLTTGRRLAWYWRSWQQPIAIYVHMQSENYIRIKYPGTSISERIASWITSVQRIEPFQYCILINVY